MAKQITMTGNVSHDEIAYLAYHAWDNDGRPPGRAVQYWLEAEAQLKATRHLLASELGLGRALKRATTNTASTRTPTRVAVRAARVTPHSAVARTRRAAPTANSAGSLAGSRPVPPQASGSYGVPGPVTNFALPKD